MMKDNRFSWLEHVKNISPLRRAGKKMFEDYKNKQTFKIEYERVSITPVRVKRGDSETRNKSPLLSRDLRFNLSGLDEDYVEKVLKKKDDEIVNLKKLYNEASSKLTIMENRQKIGLEKNSDLKRELDRKYGNGGSFDVLSKRAFSQIKYTKLNPKIILTNPIL